MGKSKSSKRNATIDFIRIERDYILMGEEWVAFYHVDFERSAWG